MPNDDTFNPLDALKFIDSLAAQAKATREVHGQEMDAKRKLENWIQAKIDANGTAQTRHDNGSPATHNASRTGRRDEQGATG